MNYVVGVDGGGTKTTAAIADANGMVTAKSAAGPINPNAVEKKDIIQTLTHIMEDLKKQNPTAFENVTNLFAGISGAGNNKAVTDLKEILSLTVPQKVVIQVEPDTVNALYSGTYGDPGIVQISGTGSITYGINSNEERDRVGGWGYLFGDEGSGYDIGRKGITAALKAFDGRGEKTMLLDMVRTHYGMENPFDLVQQIYTSGAPKSHISPVSKLVFGAYKHNDPVAGEIVANAVNDLSWSMRTLYSKLFSPGDGLNAVLCGGVFRDENVLPRLLEEKLDDFPQLTIIRPEMEPVGGSIVGAFLMDNIRLGGNAIRNIISTY
ncbi:BadF-type ATPase [Lentibacillus halodurans]|uniref:BadF-type ATPase n=1 Tax=Lentibacillus halodurans TaxID=237679 RepID=A0A1I1A3B6_9BACI|nr:BadF/BadG/BcrA/BcrD ATPase family protein [Lentibacillus halodurans]SFB32504.1 BadF-type ATPase [Lentibacillus halodurans]